MKEYRILKEIPGIANQVDTFVKLKKLTLHDIKDKKDRTIDVITFKTIEVKNLNTDFKESSEYKVLDIKKVLTVESDITLLVDLGYIEEYVDKFAA